MAKPYAQEMERLAETFAWANAASVDGLRDCVRRSAASPLFAIGSGGSLTAAHALAGLHRLRTKQLAVVGSPLETVQPMDGGIANWLISAGGGNVDILRAAERIIRREPSHITVLCGRENSPLAEMCREHPFVDLLIYPPPAGKDGFLATNSLLGFVTLLARAYAEEFERSEDRPVVAPSLSALVDSRSSVVENLRRSTDALWARPTTLVLYGPSTSVGAVDLESKFTEAAIGNVQLADYRNFAHGRHHWLAKRGDASGILAFISDEDKDLAERTLNLIPDEIPVARVCIEGFASAAIVGSLAAALRIAGWAGNARGIDPGKPGVPDFGRKLYNMPLPKRSKPNVPLRISARDEMAIIRKTGCSLVDLAERGDLDRWRRALQDFKERLQTARFAAVVFDYDGTLVDTRHRFEPASDEVVSHLLRLLRDGIAVGIATGRGGSVRRDLRSRLPESLWSNVLVGYYNGAEIDHLDVDAVPGSADETCEPLREIARALRRDAYLTANAEQTDRKYQITLTAKRRIPEERLWEAVNQVAIDAYGAGVRVTRSTHSVDLLAPGVSKLSVVQKLRSNGTGGEILSIGDRGRWPGNDFDLLGSPLSLSVDETNADPSTCWNLGDWGQRGVGITLDYLAAFITNEGLLGVDSTALK